MLQIYILLLSFFYFFFLFPIFVRDTKNYQISITNTQLIPKLTNQTPSLRSEDERCMWLRYGNIVNWPTWQYHVVS